LSAGDLRRLVRHKAVGADVEIRGVRLLGVTSNLLIVAAR